jgi:hypothetical protein
MKDESILAGPRCMPSLLADDPRVTTSPLLVRQRRIWRMMAAVSIKTAVRGLRWRPSGGTEAPALFSRTSRM